MSLKIPMDPSPSGRNLPKISIAAIVTSHMRNYERNKHKHSHKARELARTRPTCLLDRQFFKNLLFGQAEIPMMIFQF